MVHRFLLCGALALLLAACGEGDTKTASREAGKPGGSEQIGPYGPDLGVRARVVRSVTVETSGAVPGAFTGSAADEETGLMGLCNPETFANFMIAMPGGGEYDEVWVTNFSKGKIGTGETGDFRLSKLEITFRKTTVNDFVQRDFRGPGTLTLKTHESAPGNRRMTGTMAGEGLEGIGEDEGKTLNASVAFDLDFSCGVK